MNDGVSLYSDFMGKRICGDSLLAVEETLILRISGDRHC
jgi:hypothetical protein